MTTGGHVLMRWWPAGYAAGWVLFACFGTNPQLLDVSWAASALAGLGAVLLLMMAACPSVRFVRIAGTLVAIAFPLYRFLSLAWEPTPFLPTASRVVAMTAWALLAFSIVVLYPVTWFEGRKAVSNAGLE
jgi:hypothetical protein